MIKIKSFSIVGLNGMYDYIDCRPEYSMADTIVIYGENGSGKTTLLKLIYHLLSSEDNKSHLTSIAEVAFLSFFVELSNGTIVSATREDNPSGYPVKFRIESTGHRVAEYSFIPSSLRDRFFQENMGRYIESLSSPLKKKSGIRKSTFTPSKESLSKILFTYSQDENHKNYLEALAALEIKCYFVATDRSVSSDVLPERSASLSLDDGDHRDIISRTRTAYLRDALNRASRYVNRRIIESSKDGSQDTNQIFINLIKKMMVGGGVNAPYPDGDRVSLDDVAGATEKILANNDRFVRMGILPPIDSEGLLDPLRDNNFEQREVLLRLVSSYAETLRARHRALESITSTVEEFLRMLNELLRHKKVLFSPSGFSIVGMTGEPLTPKQLSSGEQQLLLMFCYLLSSNEHNSIFIVDEPEISLNVKWQRRLLDAMRDISKVANKQIIVATHSIELLSQHSELVVALEPHVTSRIRQNYDNPKEND